MSRKVVWKTDWISCTDSKLWVKKTGYENVEYKELRVTNGSTADLRVVPCHHLSSIPVAATISITAAAAAAAPPPDIEREAEVDANHELFPSITERSHHLLNPISINRSKLVIAFCIGSALEIAHQAQSQSHDQLPSTLYICRQIHWFQVLHGSTSAVLVNSVELVSSFSYLQLITSIKTNPSS